MSSIIINKDTNYDTVDLIGDYWKDREDPHTERRRRISINASLEGSHFLNLSRSFMVGWDTPNSELLHSVLQKMVAAQDDVLKKWFCEHFLGTTQLVKVPDTKPSVSVLDKMSNFLLPGELMEMILEAADLEICVALRQVSSQWYSIFSRMDFAAKVQARNPWISPKNEDFSTWQECVLVCAARLKWPSTQEHSKFNFNLEASKPQHHPLITVPLGFQEKLPENFVAMNERSGCKQLACEHIHFDDIFIKISPWTLQEDDRILHEDPDPEYILRCGEGVEVSYSDELPEHVLAGDFELWIPHVVSTHVIVQFPDHTAIVMQRDKPNFKDGIYFDLKDQVGYGEVGEAFCVSKGVEYSIADFESKQLVPYFSGAIILPAAFYNGLIWLDVCRMHLVPTFLDLQTPGKLYYHPEKVISVRSGDELYRQGSRSRDSSHLLVSCSDSDWKIIDIENSTVTDIMFPSSVTNTPPQLFPGYLNGKFMAYFLEEEGFEKTREMILERERPVARWGEELEGREVVV